MTQTASAATQTESVAEFAARARKWLAENMPRSTRTTRRMPTAARKLRGCGRANCRSKLYDGGFAGICFPREYGGLGLPIEYQRAFDIESRCYEMPIILNTPTFTICAATILDMGSEDQKRDAHRRRRCVATRSWSSCSPNPAAAPTWPVSSPAPTGAATSGSSTARRPGAQALSPPTTG